MGLRKRPYSEDRKDGKKKDAGTRTGSGKTSGDRKGSGTKRNDRASYTTGRKPENASYGKSSGSYREKSEGSEKRSYKKPAPSGGFERRTRSGDFSGAEERRPYKRTTRSDGDSENKRPYVKRDSGKGNDDRRGYSRPGADSRAPYKKSARSSGEQENRRPYTTRESGKGNDRRTFGRDGSDDRSTYRKSSGEYGGGEERRPYRKTQTGGSAGRNRREDDRGARMPYRKYESDQPENSGGERSSRPRVSRSGKPYMVKGAKARDTKAKSDEMLAELNPEVVRLNRYISNAGICSRREADDLIAAGLVTVNGNVVTEMGLKVQPGDEVRYNNERLSWEKKVYLVMNKPKDTITTSDDPDGRKIIMDLIKDPRLPRVYPVGRLDRNTTGVIVLTNDGELAQRLTHPKYNVTKVYKAVLNKNFTAKDMQELASNGVELEDGPIKPDVIGIPSANEKNVVMVQIHSGRNRIIHRMFEAMGYLVDKLDRIDFAGLERKGLDRGEWRHLDEKEIKKLKKLVQLK